MVNLDFAKREAEEYGELCPFCKNPIVAKTASIGFRISNNYENMKNNGERVIYNYNNWLVTCSKACSTRVTASWSGPLLAKKRSELLVTINTSIKEFESSLKGV